MPPARHIGSQPNGDGDTPKPPGFRPEDCLVPVGNHHHWSRHNQLPQKRARQWRGQVGMVRTSPGHSTRPGFTGSLQQSDVADYQASSHPREEPGGVMQLEHLTPGCQGTVLCMAQAVTGLILSLPQRLLSFISKGCQWSWHSLHKGQSSH